MFNMALNPLVLLLVLTISTFASSEKCTNPLPALMQMASGVDITALDLFPIGDLPEQRGLLENVFNLTCSGMTIGRKLWWNQDAINGFNDYNLPDQIQNIAVDSEENPTEMSPVLTKWSDVRGILLGRFHLYAESYAELVLGAFARNTKYTSLLKQHFGSNQAFYDIGTRSAELRLQIDGNANQQSMFSHDFVDFINHKLPPKYEDNPAAYETFIKRFGTHYFDAAYISNYEYVQFALTQDYLLDTSDDHIDNDMNSTYKNYFKRCNNCTSIGSNSSQVVLAYSSRENKFSRWLDKLNGVQYRSSQYTGLLIHEAILMEIERLIYNETIRAQVVIAVRMHRIRAQLEELNNIYNFTSDYYQLSNEEKVSHEKLNKLVNSGDIKQMDQMVAIVLKLYYKAIQFRDNHFYGRIIEDFYVTASTKLEFAKQVCPLLVKKHPKEQKPQCPAASIRAEQNETSNLYEDYHGRRYDNSAFEEARRLNQRYGFLADLTNGLRASCGDC